MIPAFHQAGAIAGGVQTSVVEWSADGPLDGPRWLRTWPRMAPLGSDFLYYVVVYFSCQDGEVSSCTQYNGLFFLVTDDEDEAGGHDAIHLNFVQ